MSTYDRREAKQVTGALLGTFGVSYEQLAAAIREDARFAPGTNVNIQFGPVQSRERGLAVPFTGSAAGMSVNGRVVFQVVESSARQWGGSAILLESRVEVDT